LARIYNLGSTSQRVSGKKTVLETLEDFHPENDHTGGPAQVSNRPEGQPMSIAELLASSISIEWYEAVAVSQAICDRLRQSVNDSGSVRIGPSQVFIDESGNVHLAAAPAKGGRRALDEVADLLRSMLPADAIPTPLRLALSQTAMTPSVEEWAKTIAYYERPNRVELIQALYLRANDPSSRASAPAIHTVPVPPVPVSEGRERRAVKQRTGNAAAAILGTVGLVAIVGALGFWLVQTRRADPSSVPSQAADATPVIASTTLNAQPSFVETLVNRIPIIGARVKFEEDTPRLPGGEWINLPPYRARSADTLPVAMPVNRSHSMSLGYAPQQMPDATSSATIDALMDMDAAAITYSAADSDVVPPVAVYPQFPSIPSGTDVDDVAQFEVVVNQSGQVESVKARSAPESLSEALTVTMSLSAAKTWRFSPGLRNGRPVRYLKVISVLKNR
jgi:hypothetical protein